MRLTIRTITLIVLVLLLAATTLQLTGCGTQDETPATQTDDAQDTQGSDAEPVSDGDALVDALCTRCHSRIQVDNAVKSAAEWDATIERMIRNGADVTEEQKAQLTEFLSGE